MPRLFLRVVNGIGEPSGPGGGGGQRLVDRLLAAAPLEVIRPTLTDARPLVDRLLAAARGGGLVWADGGYTAADEGTSLTAPAQAPPHFGGDALAWYCRGFMPALLQRLLLREETAAGGSAVDAAVRVRWFAVRSYNKTVVDLVGPFLSSASFRDIHSLCYLEVREVWDFLRHVKHVIATPSFSRACGRISHVFWITSRGITYVVCVIHEMHMEMMHMVLQPTADLRGQQDYPLSFLSTMHAIKEGLALNKRPFNSSSREDLTCVDDQLWWCIRVGSHQKTDPLGIQSLLPRLNTGVVTSVPASPDTSRTFNAKHSHSDCSNANTESFQQRRNQQLPSPSSLPPVPPVSLHHHEPSRLSNAQSFCGRSCFAPDPVPTPDFRLGRAKQYHRAHTIPPDTAISTHNESSLDSSESAQRPVFSPPIKQYVNTAQASDRICSPTENNDHQLRQNQPLSGISGGHTSYVPTPNEELSCIVPSKCTYSHTSFTSAYNGDVIPGTYSEDSPSSTNLSKSHWQQKRTEIVPAAHRRDAIEAQFSRICEPWEPEMPSQKHLPKPRERVNAHGFTRDMYGVTENLSHRYEGDVSAEPSGKVVVGAGWFPVERQRNEQCQLTRLEATARSALEAEFHTSHTDLCAKYSLAMRDCLASKSNDPLEIALREAQKTYAAAQEEWEWRAAQQAQMLLELEAAVAAAEAKHAQRQRGIIEDNSAPCDETKCAPPLAALREAVRKESVRALRGMHATLSATCDEEDSFAQESTLGYTYEGSDRVAHEETRAAPTSARKESPLDKVFHLPLRSTRPQSVRHSRGRSGRSERSPSPPLRWSRTMLAEVHEACEEHRMLCGALERRRRLAEEARDLKELCRKEEQAVWAAREELGRERQTVRQLSEIVEELEKMN